MAFCSNCGAGLPDNAAFCQVCGTGRRVITAVYQNYSSRINAPEVKRFENRRKSAAIVFMLLFALGLLIFLLIYSFVTKKLSFENALLIYLVVMGITLFFTFISRQVGKKTWDGVITDKQIVKSYTRHDDGDSYWDETVYIPTLYIRKANGGTETVKLPDNHLLYYYVVGEQVRKHSGFPYPERLIKQGPLLHCIFCGKLFDINAQQCPKCKLPSIK